MSKENKINAILNILANKENESDIIEFIELDSDNNEIKREIVKFPTNREPSTITIGIRSEIFDRVKSNLISLKEQLSK